MKNPRKELPKGTCKPIKKFRIFTWLLFTLAAFLFVYFFSLSKVFLHSLDEFAFRENFKYACACSKSDENFIYALDHLYTFPYCVELLWTREGKELYLNTKFPYSGISYSCFQGRIFKRFEYDVYFNNRPQGNLNFVVYSDNVSTFNRLPFVLRFLSKNVVFKSRYE
ncbi:MAG: hypothetical protein ABII64_01935 [Elusimicrobiota bacterium]